MGILTNTAAPLSTAGNMDKITGEKKLKDLFRVDKVLHDNFLFKLHHQANFAIILFGVAFIFGMNYLNGNAIECKGGGDFEKQYCWLHGAGHIDSKLSPQDIKCKADQNTWAVKEDERHTRYYLWVPFVLVLCLAVIKAPRVLWKEVCERGMIAGAVREGVDLTTQPADKIAERFRKLKKTGGQNRLFLGFFVCEVLNIVSVILCFTILNALFGEKFLHYGTEFIAPSADVDPLCNLFPTVVSCDVWTGRSTGNPDVNNMMCLLSNNLFNQYYFLIIWFWWVALLTLSALGLVYRLSGICLTAVSRWVFLRKLEPHGVQLTDGWRQKTLERLSSADLFLLGRICQNLKGSQIGKLLQELNKPVGTNPRSEGNHRTEPQVELHMEAEGNTENQTMLELTTTTARVTVARSEPK